MKLAKGKGGDIMSACHVPGPGYSTGFVLVLYILLVIVLGAGFFI